MSFFCSRRGDEDAAPDEFEFRSKPKASSSEPEAGREVRVVDAPRSGVITHRALNEIRAAAEEKFAVAQFASSRNPKKTIQEKLRERRLLALETAKAKRTEGRGVARPVLFTRVSRPGES